MIIKYHNIATLFFSLIALVSLGQEDYLEPVIEISGHSEIEVVPDRIYVSITIREREEGKEKVTIAEQEEKLISGLEQVGIAPADLTVTHLKADHVRVRWRTKDVIAKKEYSLLLRKSEELSKAFELFDQLSINNSYVEEYKHSKEDELRLQVKKQAMVNAKSNATEILSSVNEELGSLIYVSETNSSRMPPRLSSSVASVSARGISSIRSTSGNYMSEENVLEFEKIKFTASIYAIFEISSQNEERAQE